MTEFVPSSHSETGPTDARLSCYFVPTATRRSVGMITSSLRSNCRMTVSISLHNASRLSSPICSRNGRISGREFRRCSIAAVSDGNRWTLATLSTATSRKPARSNVLRSTAGSPSANIPGSSKGAGGNPVTTSNCQRLTYVRELLCRRQDNRGKSRARLERALYSG